MAAEELAASQPVDMATDPVARDIARWAASRQLTPLAMAAIALGFGVIAAAWLTSVSMRADAIAFGALLAAFVAGRVARLLSDQDAEQVRWGVTACAALTEFAVYAGIAGGASAGAAASAGTGLAGPFGTPLRGTFLTGFGGPGTEGVWRLAVAAAIALGLLEMTGICLAARRADAALGHGAVAYPGAPGGARLVLIGAAVPIVGARATFGLLLVFAVVVFGAMLLREIRGGEARQAGDGDAESAGGLRSLPGCRGDGPLSVWIGGFMAGRLPPLPPLLVGLLVTGMLAALGLQNLSGLLMLTPAEAMLLAAGASWHSHDGPRDWLAPPLIQAGEYVYLAAAGFAGHVWPPATFALLVAVLLRHQELACRARAMPQPRPLADRRGLGWEGRMIIVGIAAATGILPVIYPLLAVYLCGLFALEFTLDWSAGHATVDG